jgi:threonine dehydrogenase-like Zn-dependent dehydrogenase
VKIAIDYCGVCGSDFQRYCSFGNIDNCGHEILGRVIASNGEKSDYVTIRTTFPCGECTFCQHGEFYKCSNWTRASINGFSSSIEIDDKCVIPLGQKDEKLEYALVEPLYVAMSLVDRLFSTSEDSFSIVGNGAIGLLAAFYLWTLGCKDVTIFARRTGGIRSNFASLLGIETKNLLASCVDLKLSNKIISTTPYEMLNLIIHNSCPYSMIVFNGISDKAQIILDADVWHFKNLTISPVFPHPQVSFATAIKLVGIYGDILKQLITHVFPLEEKMHALTLMKDKKIDYVKILIKGDRL